MCCKQFENRLTNKKNYVQKIILIYLNSKKHGKDVTVFLENFKSQNIYLKSLKSTSNVMKDWSAIKASELSQRFSGIEVYDHGLSPLLMQIPFIYFYASIFYLLFDVQIIAALFTTH